MRKSRHDLALIERQPPVGLEVFEKMINVSLTERLQTEELSSKNTTDSKSEAGTDSPAIVAVRALVGYMPDLIPAK
jgi:hypothetical protein